MTSETLFRIQLVFGYIAWLLCFGTYFWPRLKVMDRADAHRVIATLHSFRFFGLVFILPGIVGPNLPASFATFAAYGDFATGVLAIWLSSRPGNVRSFGLSSSPSISWEQLTSSSTTTTPFKPACLRWQRNSAPPTRLSSSSCPC
jgi:hypothetical protein